VSAPTPELIAVLNEIERNPPRSDRQIASAIDSIAPYGDFRSVAQLVAMLEAYSPAEPATCILQRDDLRAAAADAIREVGGR
jgi:hypothetical protein